MVLKSFKGATKDHGKNQIRGHIKSLGLFEIGQLERNFICDHFTPIKDYVLVQGDSLLLEGAVDDYKHT